MSKPQASRQALLFAELFAAPAHDYTRSLLDAIALPGLDPGWIAAARKANNIIGKGDRGNEDRMERWRWVTGSSRGIGRNFVRR